MSGALFLLLLTSAALAQPARTFVLGDGAFSWQSGGLGTDPKIVARGRLDTTNAPGNTIEFVRRPGWIGPLHFAEDKNIASRVLQGEGSIKSPNAGRGYDEQLQGIVNGSHSVAFERKPTAFEPEIQIRDIRILLDFGVPVGVHRVRFYPRNTVEPAPTTPFHSDFLRGYELWINPQRPSLSSPDVLVARSAENQQPVVDIAVPPQYVRVLTLKSLASAPFEIDEIEVYGTGYLQQATYLSDLIDLGERATIGPVRWTEEAIGPGEFSTLSVRARSGHDNTPLHYRRLLPRTGPGARASEEVPPEEYFRLDRLDRAPFAEDVENWSPWKPLINGELIAAPTPRRYAQFQIDFAGGLFATRQLDRLEFDFLVPPIADTLVAEIFPRLAEAEKPATFRYAVRLGRSGSIRGFDRLEVDTGVRAENIRSVKLDGEDLPFEIDAVQEGSFSLRFPTLSHQGALLELTFDLPIFRFGSTFSGRASNSRAPQVPQALEPGNAIRFGPGDIDELSGLSVAIPRPQIGRLVGEIHVGARLFTPNGDGANDTFEFFFNILQITRPAPVSLELFDLSGRRVHTLFSQERGIGPVNVRWDGRLGDGRLVLPGTYVWLLRVRADAFDERHSGTMGVIY